MNKIEFSDVYRFLASLGLISIGLAFFLPWFVNQNNSSLLIEEEKIKKLTTVAQSVIARQQDAQLTYNKIMPTVSIILITVGFTLLIWGLYRWSKRQTVLDKIQDEDLKSKQIQNIPVAEKREQIGNEIEIIEETTGEIISDENRQLEIDSYIQVEDSIFLQVSQNFKSNYIASQNVRIGNYEYDIILKSKDLSLYKDRIIEIKFFKNRMTISSIQEAATKLILACNHYEENFKRKTFATLIIVYSETEYDETLKKYKTDIQKYATELGKIFRINFFDKQKIVNTKAGDFFK
jgi:hypothetical protein